MSVMLNGVQDLMLQALWFEILRDAQDNREEVCYWGLRMTKRSNVDHSVKMSI